MECALEQARRSPRDPSKFNVGAVLVDAERNEIISAGWSMDFPDDNPRDPGKTYAEQCCFIKLAQRYNLPEERLSENLPQNLVLYTTLEPRNRRTGGKWPCVDRILALGGLIKVVYVGIMKPEKFIGKMLLTAVYEGGRKRLQDAAAEVRFVDRMDELIMNVTMVGQEK
jgi:pyrimidine deaminase RibD-like protein